MTREQAAQFATLLGAELSLSRTQRMMLRDLLTNGPHDPVPRRAWCQPGSKSGDVIFSRLRKALAPLEVDTVFPEGRGAAAQALKFRGLCLGYALTPAAYEALCDKAARLLDQTPTQAPGLGA